MFIKMWKLSSRSFRKSRNYKNFILIFKYQKKPIKLKTDKKIKYKKQTKFHNLLHLYLYPSLQIEHIADLLRLYEFASNHKKLNQLK